MTSSASSSPNLNLNMAIERVGEFGRSQWLLTFVTCIARSAGNYLFYPFAYLVLEQHYLCKHEDGAVNYEFCPREEICAKSTESPFEYQIDTGYQYYINNWFVEMDLVCTPMSSIRMIVTSYFIGFLLGGLAYAIPDIYGRKKALLIGLTLNCIG